MTDLKTEHPNYTSIDLYYQGFHIKKSYPKVIKLDKLASLIEKAIEKGFEPSWNAETNAQQDPIMKVTEEENLCPMHGEPTIKSKRGNWWHKNEATGEICVGKGYFKPKKP